MSKKARIKNQNDESLSQLSQSLVECDKMLKKSMEDVEEDETTLFCRSLIPIMKELPIKENRRAMIKIKTLLFSMKYGEQVYIIYIYNKYILCIMYIYYIYIIYIYKLYYNLL